MKIHLIVHETSYYFIRTIVADIKSSLCAIFMQNVDLSVCRDVSETIIEGGSIVFVIGDPFNDYKKMSNCTYIFINFSLLYKIGKLSCYSARAIKWIEKKHGNFARKVKNYDFIFDFFPPQTSLIEAE